MPKNNSIGKINAGIFRQRGKHNLNHNVATTFDFGRVQPLFCKYMTPNSKVQGSLDAKVRVMPMPLPPFGDVRMKVFGQFVPCADLMHSWPEFMAGQTYNSSIKSYVPTHTPRFLNGINIPSTLNSSGNNIEPSLLSILMTFGKWTFYPAKVSTTSKLDTTLNDAEILRDSTMNKVTISEILPTFNPYAHAVDINFDNVINLLNSVICPIQPDAYRLGYMGLQRSNYVFGGSVDNPTFVDGSASSGIGSPSMGIATKAGFNFTPSGADFILTIPPRVINKNALIYDVFDVPEIDLDGHGKAKDDFSIVISISLNQYGRNLLSLFNALRIQIKGHVNTPKNVDLLPLFAFYKAYFDIFVPQRNVQWSSTNAHKLLDYLNQTGIDILDLFNYETATSKDHVSSASFYGFLTDCAAAYATCDPNYFTQAIDDADQSESTLIQFNPDGDITGNFVSSGYDSNNNPNLQVASVTTDTGSLSRFGILLLNRLSKFINTNTVIGRNINDFFKAHFDGFSGISEESKFAGASEIEIQLGDVISTATTADSNLGDFSGVGFGRGDYNFEYKTDQAGFFIIIASVIPVSNYVQGTAYDNYMTERLDFPWPEFDALGYDKLYQDEICELPTSLPCGSKKVDMWQSPNIVFGYSPRYTGYKVHQSVYSGSFCLRGLRDSYLPFTLDNFITNDVTKRTELSGGDVQYDIYYPDNLMCGVRWRYLNKYPFFNNFERIFYSQRPDVDEYFFETNTNPYEDNFVAYIGVKCTLTDGLLPISSSYDTIEGSDFYVKKA